MDKQPHLRFFRHHAIRDVLSWRHSLGDFADLPAMLSRTVLVFAFRRGAVVEVDWRSRYCLHEGLIYFIDLGSYMCFGLNFIWNDARRHPLPGRAMDR